MHGINKYIICLLLTVFLSCSGKTEFERKLSEGNGAWNTYLMEKDSLTYSYDYLMVFKKDRRWKSYGRSAPDDPRIIGNIYFGEMPDYPKYSFNRSDSLFRLNNDPYEEEGGFKLSEIKGDSIFFESLYVIGAKILYVKDNDIEISDFW